MRWTPPVRVNSSVLVKRVAGTKYCAVAMQFFKDTLKEVDVRKMMSDPSVPDFTRPVNVSKRGCSAEVFLLCFLL